MKLSSATQALDTFICGVITKPRRERYRTIIRSKKRQQEFVQYLDHDLEQYLRDQAIVTREQFDRWHHEAYAFNVCRDDDFGAPKSSVSSAFEEEEGWGGWLIISRDGKAGIFRPEEPSDEIFLKT